MRTHHTILIHTCARARTHMHAQIYTYNTCTNIHMYTHMHAHTPHFIYTYAHTPHYTHTHTHAHTHTHHTTHTHTYTHTHTHTGNPTISCTPTFPPHRPLNTNHYFESSLSTDKTRSIVNWQESMQYLRSQKMWFQFHACLKLSHTNRRWRPRRAGKPLLAGYRLNRGL
jgi:hypothetical protein